MCIYLVVINLLPNFAASNNQKQIKCQRYYVYFGLRFYFYSREHEPMHVHVKSADGKAKFDILPDGIVLVYNKGLKPKDIKCAEMVLEENKDLAIAKWNEYFGSSMTEEED